MKLKQLIPPVLALIIAIGAIILFLQPKLPKVTNWKKEFMPIEDASFFYQAIYTDYSNMPYKIEKYDNGLKRYLINFETKDGKIEYCEYNNYFDFSSIGENIFILDDSGVYLTGSELRSVGRETVTFKAEHPVLFYRFPIKLNDPVEVREMMFGKKSYFDVVCTGYEKVKTFAGDFNAYKFVSIDPKNRKKKNRSLQELWYVPGMTDVRIIDNMPNKKIKHEYILTEYKIPKKTDK